MNLSLTYSCSLVLSYSVIHMHTQALNYSVKGKWRGSLSSMMHRTVTIIYFQTNTVRNIQHKILYKPHQEMSLRFSLVTQSLYNVDWNNRLFLTTGFYRSQDSPDTKQERIENLHLFPLLRYWTWITVIFMYIYLYFYLLSVT